MRLSTMTNLFYVNRPDERGYVESVIRTRKAGFKVMDMCMCPMQRRETELNGDNWEAITYDIANEAAKLGVEFSQSHLPYPKLITKRNSAIEDGCEQNDYFVEMTYRAIRISATLGVKWAVVHPVAKEVNFCATPDEDIRYNLEIYGKYIELASSLGVGIAFENMADVGGKRRFGALPCELLAINKAFGNPDSVGICWDFGHANREFVEPAPRLMEVMPRLRATHVDDNIGVDDLHQLPFLGNIKWAELMPLLAEGGYTGDFNYEIKFTSNFPDPLKDDSAVFAYSVGNYLISLAKSKNKNMGGNQL